MNIALLGLSILLAAGNNLLLHRFNNRGLRGIGDVLLFNGGVSLIWILVLGLYGGFALPSGSAIRWGILYGTVQAAMLLSKMEAMCTGPVSVTAFIGCSSMLLSTGYCVLFRNEPVSVMQGIGFVLMIAALFLIVSPKGGTAKPSWKYWSVLFWLCGGACGIVFKMHQASDNAAEITPMMMTAATLSAVLFALSAVIFAGRQQHGLPRVPRSAWGYLLAAGVASCLYNRLNIGLAGELPGVLFFPGFNGAVILISSLVGALFFGEKLRRSQIAGLAIGMGALVLLAL